MDDGCVKMSLRLIERVFQLISLVLFGLVVYMLLQKITGHSPTIEDVLLGFIITQFSLFIAFAIHSAMFHGKVSEFMSNTKYRLNSLEQRMGGFENKMSSMENKIDRLLARSRNS